MFGTPHVHQKRRGASVALQDFTLLAKLEDFDVETHKIVQKFQKAERHVLSASIRGNVEQIIFLVIMGAKEQLEERRKKRPPVKTLEILKSTDIRLEYLKMQIRKAYKLRQIDEKTYEMWAGMARELGGLLGGWLKKVEPYVDSARNNQNQKQNSLLSFGAQA